jgi:hypothetical protein
VQTHLRAHAHGARDRPGQVMQVQNRLADPVSSELLQDAGDQRLAADRQRGFCAQP